MFKLGKYIVRDLIKNRIILGYILLMSVIGWGAFFLESQPQKVLLGLMQLTLFALPLITMVFSTIYYYNSIEFMILLLVQPIDRSTVIKSFYIGITASFVFAYLIGIGLPLIIFYPVTESLFLMIGGIMLTMIFVAIALYISTWIREKTRGMGVTLLLWAFFAIIYDGLLLLFIYQFGDYPIEKGVMVLTIFNPIDVTRISILMKTEASALMGVSGAVFRQFFGGVLGIWVCFFTLVIWSIIPFSLTKRKFLRMDI